jgi:polyribonucleotide 5'-hydroxyl-kinase
MSSNKTERKLNANAELRCEVSPNEILTLRIVEGIAEIFGAELALNKDYCFRGRSFAVFTWFGCKLITELSHATTQNNAATHYNSHLYETDQTPMIGYVNTHIQLEARRDVALANNSNGPRVLIVGPPDHGKTSIAQLLSNYSLRLDRRPIFVDLDIDQGLCSMPGCISAIPLNKSLLSPDVSFIF